MYYYLAVISIIRKVQSFNYLFTTIERDYINTDVNLTENG